MVKKLPIIVVLILCIGLNGCINETTSNNVKIIIEGKGSYSSIQSAIENASNGDVIQVAPGTYYETLVINKSITLVGSGAEKTIISCKDLNKGFKSTNIVMVNADNCTIKGFTITFSSKNSSAFTHGVVLNSNNNTISNNLISSCLYGLYTTLHNISNNFISCNIIKNNTFGISLYGANNNIIFKNNISYNTKGLSIIGGKHNRIFKNTFSHNYRGISVCCSSANNTISNNTFIFNNINAEDYSKNTNLWSYNYWDNYNGIDENKDGIGDIPYTIIGSENNFDRYPRMEPFSILN